MMYLILLPQNFWGQSVCLISVIFNARFDEFNSLEMDYSASDIIIGNPKAEITITTVMNTRCGPCALAHRKINRERI
ncbi:MAG: hypothetical protein FWD60_07870 [Candidatus Azobacteroides sp.]|nr:hypothetical protein [Candidatus Azobacteroides sp.]